MAEILYSLMNGFATVLQPEYMLYVLIGTVLGTITGVLPGLGPLGAMAILLGFTLKLDATGAMILFAGIYYGAMYGGSTTSILLNIPGEAASVVTCLDGYKMAQKGRAGAALTVSAAGSFFAGTVSIFGLMVACPFLANMALKFGPPEFFAIGIFGLALLVRLTGGSTLKSLIMILIGMLVGTIGMDLETGARRFTLGLVDLDQGIDFLPAAMGLFGIAEVLACVNEGTDRQILHKVGMRELLPTREEWRRSLLPIFRGSFSGFFIGLVPGPSPVIATFISYMTEKKLSKHPERFGEGAIEGVAGPESANNSAVGGAYVPLFALGIPFTPAMAMVLGALMLHGLTPGPNLIYEKPGLFWGVVASMYIGNAALLVLNLPLVNLFVSILKVPRHILMPVVVLICLIGVYSVNSSRLDLLALSVFGLAGYALRKVGYQTAPLILAMVLGPMIESAFRQSMIITGGHLQGLLFRPICLALYLCAALSFVLPLIVMGIKRLQASGARAAVSQGNK
ncbi:MAG: tripartite tricarboxylate transporter permease [Desulfobacterales bacterium]|jgi:putative tricarboxylic transport membrane protein|nr:tripartite tricarboxylate transporter permease [Desulfobacterales bacterium]